jgi:hypothetical protein
MRTRLAAGAVTLATAVPAFALSRVIWPDPPGAPVPPPRLLPFLLVPAIFEALEAPSGKPSPPRRYLLSPLGFVHA